MFISPQRKLPIKTCLMCSFYFKQYNQKQKQIPRRASNACMECYLAKVKCEGMRPCLRCKKLSLCCVNRTKKQSTACAHCQRSKKCCKHNVKNMQMFAFLEHISYQSDYDIMEFVTLIYESFSL